MSGPLAGVRVIEIATMLMAPYATQILGDMGADVIKVEAPNGDPVRGIGPLRNPGMGAIYLQVNRSKRSVVLDLKSEAGLAALLDLIATADVVVTNVRPKALERLGIDYATLASRNPKVIFVSLFGYGQAGRHAPKPAFDDLIQGAVGVPWLSHAADGGEPRYAPTAIVDRGVALFAVGQITAALFHRERSHRGQEIAIPMFEMMASFVLGDHLSGRAFEPPLGDAGYPRMLNPYRKPYPTADGFICVMIYTDRHWRSFFDAIGRIEEFDRDDRYHSMNSRSQHIADIYRDLAELLRTRSTTEWLALFDRADIPAMPLNTIDQLLEDPHLKESGFFSSEQHPSEGALRTMAYPSTWSVSQPGATRHAPLLGEHTREVLIELGYDAARIAAITR